MFPTSEVPSRVTVNCPCTITFHKHQALMNCTDKFGFVHNVACLIDQASSSTMLKLQPSGPQAAGGECFKLYLPLHLQHCLNVQISQHHKAASWVITFHATSQLIASHCTQLELLWDRQGPKQPLPRLRTPNICKHLPTRLHKLPPLPLHLLLQPLVILCCCCINPTTSHT